MRSAILVALQFLFGVFILLPVPLAAHPAAILAQALGFALVCWASLVLNTRSFSVLPAPRAAGALRTAGPYRAIRHPIYTGVLLYTLAQALDEALPLKLCAWGGLLVVLVVKLQFEERLLTARFPEYARYRDTTCRIVPWVW